MNDFCDEQADVEILSELFKNSKVEPRLDDFVNGGDPLDALYQQAVEVAEELEWAVPSREEFEEQYRQEIEKLRRHEMSAR
jgi:hypothetical protein